VLAYLFWHRSRAGEPSEHYERRLIEFHDALKGVLVESATFRLQRLPFAETSGYEDWYLVDDWAALGELNSAAVDAALSAPHDAVARVAAEGWGGIYRLVRGTPEALSGAHWTSKPEGERYASFLRRQPAHTIWQRQLVLGPAPEFCLSAEPSPARLRVWPRELG